MILIRKKILFKNKSYNIIVDVYYNGRLRLKYGNSEECHDITLNIKDLYLDIDRIFIDPAIIKNNLFHILLKERIIDDVTGLFMYNYKEIPVCSVNLKRLRKYDFAGVNKYLNRKEHHEK